MIVEKINGLESLWESTYRYFRKYATFNQWG